MQKITPNKKFHGIVEVLTTLIGLNGVLSWFFLFICNYGFIGDYMRGKELPLGLVYDIAIDSRGFVYCNSDYNRIQVYDPNGAFVDSWKIESSGGAYYIKMDKKDFLHVYTVRGYRHYIYDLDGTLLKTEERKSKSNSKHSCQLAPCSDAAGNLYELEHGLPALVTRATPSGGKKIVVSQPFYYLLITAPLPAWLFAMFGFLMSYLFKRKRKKESPRL